MFNQTIYIKKIVELKIETRYYIFPIKIFLRISNL